jgi:hypothetical protein
MDIGHVEMYACDNKLEASIHIRRMVVWEKGGKWLQRKSKC